MIRETPYISDCAYNNDETRFEYEMTSGRALSDRGEKHTISVASVTHYNVQNLHVSKNMTILTLSRTESITTLRNTYAVYPRGRCK